MGKAIPVSPHATPVSHFFTTPLCFYSNLHLPLSERLSHCGYLGLQKPMDDPQPFLTNCDNVVTSSTLFWLQGIDTHSNYFAHKKGYLFIRTQRYFSKPNGRKCSHKGRDPKAAALLVSRSSSSSPLLPPCKLTVI